jgi:hypothetical protein
MTRTTTEAQNQDSIYAMSADFVLYRGKEGEPGFFLFNLKDGKMFRLNKTSFAMLESLDGKRTIAAAVELLATTLRGNHAVVFKDILSMLSLWQEKGIVCKCDSRP